MFFSKTKYWVDMQVVWIGNGVFEEGKCKEMKRNEKP